MAASASREDVVLDGYSFVRWLALVLGCALALVTWSSCESTETGNPPFVNESGLFTRFHGEDLIVGGEAGTVFPGGSIVEVTDRGTGQRVSVRSNEDGSFELTIPNASDEGVAVRAVNGTNASKPASLGPTARAGHAAPAIGAQSGADAGEHTGSTASDTDAGVDAGGASAEVNAGSDAAGMHEALEGSASGDASAAVPDADSAAFAPDDAGAADAHAALDASGAQLPNAACDELNREAQQRIRQATAPAEEACSAQGTCVVVATATTCLQSCGVLVAASSAAAVQTAVEQTERDICSRHAALSCAPVLEPCDELGLACALPACAAPGGPRVISVVRDY
jgi:hypothetical protein